MENSHIVPLGWDTYINKSTSLQLDPNATIGRISEVFKDQYQIMDGKTTITGILAGKFYYAIQSKAELPAVGDWVQYKPIPGEHRGIIQEVLPRVSLLSRKGAGKKTTEQLIAANIDVLFIVQGLDHDFNPRRLERYLLMSMQNGISPVIILNKADLAPDAMEKVEHLKQALSIPDVHAISAVSDVKLECVWPYLKQGTTAVFLGSSGAGKSTILNQLLGKEKQKVQPVREDDSRGRHTTTTRQMFRVKSGALVIDTPGMRELEPWSADESLGSLFPEIEEYALECHYRDCSHDSEPGCAVLQAIEDGKLSSAQLLSYKKLLREQEYQHSRLDEQAFLERKQKEKSFHKQCRKFMRERQGKHGKY